VAASRHDATLTKRGSSYTTSVDSTHAAERLGEPLVVLEGSPRYYGRLGFRYAPALGITMDLPERAFREAAQVFLLPAHDPGVRGHVEYPPAIAEITS